MVFGKFISRFQDKKSDHPLGSDANLDAVLAEIPRFEPAHLLLDVDHWLGGMESWASEIGAEAAVHALLRLDQFSRPAADELLVRYLSAGKREYLADSVWSALETHAAYLFEGYKAAVNAAPEPKSDNDKVRLARCAALALRAWALRKKLQHFRYRRPSAELWLDAHHLLQVVGRRGLMQTSVLPYRDERLTTPLREYLIGLYLEFVPIGNMVPQQLELAERFLRSCDGLELSPQPHQLSTDRIDLAAGKGPQRRKADDAGGESIRYCSVLKLRGALMKFAAQTRKADEAPDWLTSLPATPDQIEGGLLTLITHWAQTPPKRGTDRVGLKAELRVVLGFGLARRMIAVSHFARMGRVFEYESDDLDHWFDESRFGSVELIDSPREEALAQLAAPEVSSPFEILNKLELTGDKAQMERWLQVDQSATGLGAVVPAVLPRHRVGLLICLRTQDSIDWRMGLIRRIGRDAENRPGIGIETLAWPSMCALAKPVGGEIAWSKHATGRDGWSEDAIIVSREGREIVLQAGSFVPGMEVDVRCEEGLWRVRLETLLDHGPDFERIEFTRIS